MMFIGLLVFAVISVLLLLDSFIIVKQQTAVVLERLGKFHSVREAGFQLKLPIFDRVRSTVSLQIQQLDVNVETKTKDNVFVKTKISVQLKVMKDKVKEAVYELTNPFEQGESYIFDVVRSEVPKMTLDEVFETKDKIALAIKESLQDKMTEYGYEVETSLVTDLDPDAEVKAAMNKIQTTERLKIAATNEAEADKIRVVAAAKADAEAKKLTGKGYADLREEIARGAKESIDTLVDTGLSAQEAQGLILSTQYFETLQNMGEKGNGMIMLPGGASGANDIMNQLIASGFTNDKLKKQA